MFTACLSALRFVWVDLNQKRSKRILKGVSAAVMNKWRVKLETKSLLEKDTTN